MRHSGFAAAAGHFDGAGGRQGMSERSLEKKWWMTWRHAELRLQWACVMSETNPQEWAHVYWCDEKTFCVGAYGRVYVTRPCGTAYQQRFIRHDDRFAPKVQVSIGFAANGIGSIHIFDGNMDARKYISILGNHHLPAARRIFGYRHSFFLAHDNNKKHTAKNCL